MTGRHLHVVVMGVSGTGKSTVAQAMATGFDLEMAEGDDHHPPANLAKMAAGTALDDADRAPWLASLAHWTRQAHDADRPTVITCSALRRRYREVLRAAVPEPTVFVHLTATRSVLAERVRARTHFMPPELLDSQLHTLEPLEDDETGDAIDTDQPVPRVVEDAVAAVRRAGHVARDGPSDACTDERTG